MDYTKLAVHLIPYNGIGGVESAARTCLSGVYSGFRFSKYFLCSHPDSLNLREGDQCGRFKSENDPRNLIQALLLLHRQRPQVLIASLWRSYVVVIFYKILHPRCQVVCFLHSSRAVHIIDFFLAFSAMCLARQIWLDCQATRATRVPVYWRHKSYIISFILNRAIAVTSELVQPRFIFWGRLAPEKGLDRAFMLIAALKYYFPSISMQVVGPDQGEQIILERIAKDLHIGDSVSFLGVKGPEEIVVLASQASFYLQTSIYEGTAVSVMEAMQLGLVPLVTPVGEILNYCHDNVNSILINHIDIASSALRIRRLIGNPARYSRIRSNAIRTWADAPIYCDDIIRRCQRLLSV